MTQLQKQICRLLFPLEKSRKRSSKTIQSTLGQEFQNRPLLLETGSLFRETFLIHTSKANKLSVSKETAPSNSSQTPDESCSTSAVPAQPLLWGPPYKRELTLTPSCKSKREITDNVSYYERPFRRQTLFSINTEQTALPLLKCLINCLMSNNNI